jgi:thioredoxin-related protein
MAINVLFSKKTDAFAKWVLKVWRLSRELWWTGSPVAIFENENQWEIAEIPGWFSPGDFVLILKNFLLLWERMRFAKYKMFYKISLHKILLFLQNTLSSTYSMHYI